MKERKIRNIEFYTYKSKKQGSFKVVLKHTYIYSSRDVDMDDIKKGIEEFGLIATNVWNIKNRGTNVAFHIFFIELKPGNNNKNIYELKHLLNYS